MRTARPPAAGECMVKLYPDRQQYTFWDYRQPSSLEANKGWRIDYIAATKNLEKNLVEAKMFQQVKHSDHCPVYCKIRT